MAAVTILSWTLTCSDPGARCVIWSGAFDLGDGGQAHPFRLALREGLDENGQHHSPNAAALLSAGDVAGAVVADADRALRELLAPPDAPRMKEDKPALASAAVERYSLASTSSALVVDDVQPDTDPAPISVVADPK